MSLVSVIVPVYNTEKYLKRCLESICNQTLSEIEIICVNDCSEDNSLEILKEFSKNDSRIKIIDLKKNQGASFARNIAIDDANGDYIGFVDSDDFIEKDFYEKLFTKAIETDSDIVKGCYRYCGNGYVNSMLNQKVVENKLNFSFEFCSAIFRTKFLKQKQINFPLLKDMEDPVFAFKSAINANRIEVVNNAFINIYKRSDSQTALKPTFETINDKIEGLKQIIYLANSLNNVDERANFVPALWFKISTDILEKIELNEQIIFCQNLLSIYEEIINKDAFLYYLRELSPILYENLKKKDLIFYKKDEEILKLKIELKECVQANKKLDEYNQILIKKYTTNYINSACEESVYFISVVNNYNLYQKCISENPFVKNLDNTVCVAFDNTKENIFIPKRYNSFLDNYDYSRNSWFVFCHCDWEIMEDINHILANLDKRCLYGPIGSKVEIIENKALSVLTGYCFEKRRDGSGLRALGNLEGEKQISDTFDCQALIVHSSLIKKYNLRFDENLKWDLYVEDFCINSKKVYGILSYALKFLSCHWSGYHDIPNSYYESLNYVNSKYPNDIYSGTVSLIGGKQMEKASCKDVILHKIRKK